jgi:hypothetical protein
MKHLLLVLFFTQLAFLPQTMEAQSAVAFGGNLGANFSEPGVFIRTQFLVQPRVTALATFNYFFVNPEVITLNVDLDVHYAIRAPLEGRKFDPYLILGAHLGQRAFEARQFDRYTDWGMNVGAGGNFYVGGATFFGELKYVVWGPGAQLSVGVLIPLVKKIKEM